MLTSEAVALTHARPPRTTNRTAGHPVGQPIWACAVASPQQLRHGPLTTVVGVSHGAISWPKVLPAT